MLICAAVALPAPCRLYEQLPKVKALPTCPQCSVWTLPTPTSIRLQASGATEQAEEAKKAHAEYHKQAIAVNLKAKKMREAVLGKYHLEVALNYQQMGISYTVGALTGTYAGGLVG